MSWRRRSIEALLWLALAALLLSAFYYHSAHCTFPYQLMGSEAVQLQTTRALLMGKDPWAVANAFDFSNDYGVGFPWLTAVLRPLAPGLPLLVLLRLVSAGAAFFGLGLIFLQLRHAGRDRLEALAASAAVYAGLLYYDTLCARPDALAVALYLAGILLPTRPGAKYAVMGGALAALGYFVKPYALLAAPVAGLWLWAQGRRLDVVWLALSVGLTGLALGLGIHAWSPYYFDGTYFIHLHAATYDIAHLLRQWKELARDHWPLLAGLVGAALWSRWQKAPAAKDPALRAWAWAVVGVFVALALGPGGHVGAYMRYYQQLFLPLAILAATLGLAHGGLPRWLRIAVLIADGVVMMGVNGRACPLIPPTHAKEWQAIEDWIGAHPYSLLPPVMLSVAVDKGAFVFDNDNNAYASTLSPPGPIREDAIAREKKMAGDLAAGRFQSVVTAHERPELTRGPGAHYRPAPPLCVYTPMGWQCFVVYERIVKAGARS